MGYEFKFQGGVHKHDNHSSEKFLLYFLAGGKEISFYELRGSNIIKDTKESLDEYTTPFDVCKIFVAQSGFGIPRKFYSFYFQIKKIDREVTVKPFSLGKTKMSFVANGNFLTTNQVKKHLSSDSNSYKFLKIQDPLPVETLRSMISVDIGDPLNGIRKIRSAIK